MKYLEEKGVFFIPAGREFGVSDDNAVQLVYAPLTGRSFLVKGDEVATMQAKLEALLHSGIEAATDSESLSVLFD